MTARIGGITTQRERQLPAKPGKHVRRLFRGAVTWEDDRGVLTVNRGCRGIWTDEHGDFTDETRHEQAQLRPNLDDQLIVTGPRIDDIACVRVVEVRQAGYDEVCVFAIERGNLNSASSVQVLAAWKAERS